MERLTDWQCDTMMGFLAHRIIPSGGIPMVIAFLPTEFKEEIKERGIEFTVYWEPCDLMWRSVKTNALVAAVSGLVLAAQPAP